MRPFVLFVWLMIGAAPTSVAPVVAAWDANNDHGLTNSYRVEWGQTSGVYDHMLDVGLSTFARIPDCCDRGVKYFFTVLAVTAEGKTARSAEVSYTPPAVDIDPCLFPTGSQTVFVFPTKLTKTGSEGPGSRARIDFQVASALPIIRTAILANGVEISVISGRGPGDDLTPLAGQWFTIPVQPSTYAIEATNATGCKRLQTTTFKTP